MEYRIIVTYGDRTINSAAKHFWIKSQRLNLVIGPVVLLLAWGLWFVSGGKSWLTATLIVLCLVLIIISIAVYFVYRHRSLRIFREMESPQATWKFTDDSLSVESDIGRSEFKWQIIKKLWRFDDVWLLFYANQTYSTLPVADVPEEVKQFIVERVRSQGGKVS